MLLRAGKLGGFDFNSRFYADDDLMVGAADPFQLFRILVEVAKKGALAPSAGVAFMLDQCHNIEAKIPGQIRSVMNVQEATAKALLVDGGALAAAQLAGDVLEANAVVMDAYNTDVRPLLADLREEMGLPRDPYRAYLAPGTASRSSPNELAARPPAGEPETMADRDTTLRPPRPSRRCSPGPTGWAATRATPTTPAATPPPRAPPPTRSPASRPS